MNAEKQKAAQLRKLEAAVASKRQKWGENSVSLGSQRYASNTVPSCSWMLDLKMGTEGFPYGHAVEVFGANGLGKSTVLGYTTLGNVQRQGKLPAIIAAEPAFDVDWASRFLDPEMLLIQRPDNAEQAFEMLHEMVYDDLVDYILLDSLGALAARSEEEGGGKKAFGISGVVTSGLNSVMPRLWKNNIGLMILNQQRQDTKSRSQPGMGMNYDSPGGEALHHNCVVRIQLKPGRNRYTSPMGSGKDREAEVLVGRELVCTFKKNKLAINTKSARFDFMHIPTPKYGFGVDRWEDIQRTLKVANVVTVSGSWLEHEAFPKGKVNGKSGLAKALIDDPGIEARLREEVMSVMRAEQIELRKQADAGVVAAELEDEGSVEETEEDAYNPDGVLLPNLLQGDS